VRTLRFGLLVLPAAGVGLLVHVHGDGGLWELLVWGLLLLTAALAMRLAQREATASLARIAAATGTVPYSGRLHPDGSWRGHVAGPGASRLLGAPYSAAAWVAAVHADDATAFAEACQCAARGEASEVEYRVVRPDGEIREIWDRFAPSRGGTVAGVRVDVTERRAVERQLSSTRHRLESVLRQLDDVVVTLEVRPDGSIIGTDAPGAVDAGDLLRQDTVHPDDLAAFRNSLDVIRRGERVAIGIRRVAYDGPVRRMWMRSVPREEPDGRRFADVIVSDVTDRAELTAELAATRGQLDRVLASVAAVAYTLELDEETAVPWEMSYVGPGWELVTGNDPGTPRAMAAWLMAAVHPEDRVFVEQGYLQLARGAAIDRVFRLLIPDGVRHVHERARPRTDAAGRLLADGILIDVTEVRVAEQALSEAHEDLERVVDSIDEVLCRVELGVDGWWHAIYKGPGHARLLGLPAALLDDLDFFDEVWNDALHPDDRETYVAAWSSLRPGRPIEVLYRLVSRDGTVRWLADRAKARHTPDGAIIADCISIDVTEHRRVTDELAAARQDLERIAVEGERRLAGLLSAADAGFAVLAMEAGQVVVRFADPTLARRLLGRPLPPGVDAVAAIYGALETGERERLVRAFGADDRVAVDCRLRGLDGVVRSFAVEGAVDREAATVFCVIREISRDPRIAALLDAVDEPVYELELGGDGVWRTTAGTGISRILGLDGADERVLAAAVLDEDRAVFEAHRVRLAAGQASSVEFRVRTAAGTVRWLWERAQARREGDRVIAVSAVADVTAWHPEAADESVRP
jgi:PAS domain-containing protein